MHAEMKEYKYIYIFAGKNENLRCRTKTKKINTITHTAMSAKYSDMAQVHP